MSMATTATTAATTTASATVASSPTAAAPAPAVVVEVSGERASLLVVLVFLRGGPDHHRGERPWAVLKLFTSAVTTKRRWPFQVSTRTRFHAASTERRRSSSSSSSRAWAPFITCLLYTSPSPRD